MKKNFQVLVLLILFHFILVPESFSQWQRIGSYSGMAIDAYDDSSAIIIADLGSGQGLLLTKNAGKTWQNITPPEIDLRESMIDVSMIDSSNIWIATGRGRIIFSEDGGKNWSIQFDDKTKTDFMDYIEMFDKNNGVAFGDAVSYWWMNSFCFVDKVNGWAAGYGILKTTDGGDSWQNQNLPDSGLVCGSIFFVDSEYGWITGEFANEKLYKTTNGGAEWSTIDIPFAGPENLYFLDREIGWLKDMGNLYKTTDGGFTWINKTPYSVYNPNSSFCFLDKNIGWIVAQSSFSQYTVYKTIDGGNNWIALQSFDDENIYNIKFVDSQNGWMVGYFMNDNSFEGYLYSTSNGGNNWTRKRISDAALKELYVFYDEIEGGKKNYSFRIYGGNKLLISNDSGFSWDSVKVNHYTYSQIFIDKNIGFEADNHQIIHKTVDGGFNRIIVNEKAPTTAALLKTTDGGKNWISVNDNMIGWFSGDTWRRIDFINPNDAYFITSTDYHGSIGQGGLNKTTNGGLSWNRTTYQLTADIVKFYDKNYGFIGRSAYINGVSCQTALRTTNGGVTIDTFLVNSENGWGMDIEFLPGSPSNVWYLDLHGAFFSSDSGKTWTQANISPYGRFMDLKFVNKNVGWLLTSTDVLRTENNGGFVTGISENINIPKAFYLHQNYPNPFNPGTRIAFELPGSGNIKLEVFNMLGEKVKELANGFKQAGKHQIDFNAQALPSGVYIYRLTKGSFSQNRKMILIK